MSAKAEAVGLEDVLAAHEQKTRTYFDGSSECRCGFFAKHIRERRAHLADQIRAHYAAALRSPEVVEAARAAIASARPDPSLGETYRVVRLTIAALTAAAETIEAGQ